MLPGGVGVAVDQGLTLVGGEPIAASLGVQIKHETGLSETLFALHGRAFGAHVLPQAQTLIQGLGQKFALPGLTSDRFSKPLVSVVTGAQKITVGEQIGALWGAKNRRVCEGLNPSLGVKMVGE